MTLVHVRKLHAYRHHVEPRVIARLHRTREESNPYSTGSSIDVRVQEGYLILNLDVKQEKLHRKIIGQISMESYETCQILATGFTQFIL